MRLILVFHSAKGNVLIVELPSIQRVATEGHPYNNFRDVNCRGGPLCVDYQRILYTLLSPDPLHFSAPSLPRVRAGRSTAVPLPVRTSISRTVM